MVESWGLYANALYEIVSNVDPAFQEGMHKIKINLNPVRFLFLTEEA